MHHEFKGHSAFSNYSDSRLLASEATNKIPTGLIRDRAISWCCDYLNAINTVKNVFYYEDLIDN